jgi:chromatin remodeling complex protein RSC6
MSEPAETEINETNFDERINLLVERLESSFKEIKAVSTELKILKKEHAKIVKKASGGRRKKAVKDPNAPKKAPSGFAKPTQISAELASFLGLKEGDMIARPQAIKKVSEYIKEHKLQDEKDGRVIHLNRKGGDVLAKLLDVTSETELTYFNLQTYMKSHFPKTDKPTEEKTPKAPKAPKAPKEPKEPKEPKAPKTKKDAAAKVEAETSEPVKRRRRKAEEA